MFHHIQLATFVLLAFCGLSFAGLISERQTSSGVDVTNLTKNVTSTSGEARAAAAGTLQPFGGIGIGCGINWKEGVSYGGGLQAGSSSFGLGSGFTIKPDTFDIGVGIGLNSANASANFQVSGSLNGTFEFVFESSSPKVACTPEQSNGKTKIRCKVY
ncbi:hypothetical protein GQ44DRAFT_670953 [Phaeosphaeriaceae sp. PMI808]|nr:hypothetical protein GQ44DRAFT_670953 [Phaeosphaeriaceae sp. PMI808]